MSIEDISAMNTDFTARLVTMLQDVGGRNPDFLVKLEGIAEATEKIANNLRQVDTDGATAISGGL